MEINSLGFIVNRVPSGEKVEVSDVKDLFNLLKEEGKLLVSSCHRMFNVDGTPNVNNLLITTDNYNIVIRYENYLNDECIELLDSLDNTYYTPSSYLSTLFASDRVIKCNKLVLLGYNNSLYGISKSDSDALVKECIDHFVSNRDYMNELIVDKDSIISCHKYCVDKLSKISKSRQFINKLNSRVRLVSDMPEVSKVLSKIKSKSGFEEYEKVMNWIESYNENLDSFSMLTNSIVSPKVSTSSMKLKRRLRPWYNLLDDYDKDYIVGREYEGLFVKLKFNDLNLKCIINNDSLFSSYKKLKDLDPAFLLNIKRCDFYSHSAMIHKIANILVDDNCVINLEPVVQCMMNNRKVTSINKLMIESITKVKKAFADCGVKVIYMDDTNNDTVLGFYVPYSTSIDNFLYYLSNAFGYANLVSNGLVSFGCSYEDCLNTDSKFNEKGIILTLDNVDDYRDEISIISEDIRINNVMKREKSIRDSAEIEKLKSSNSEFLNSVLDN